ncbi:hybrid sensor histidine kinase/response regulator [Fontisphaera persica]|uniref:hybrid sensor histidine kinase/response regulator n=1 Tax=Fontisphaera persica TaxID=2974023 RepID=UPI0024C03AC4|nr:hybrid sensor histidine kinase/response regulator [Fontisphaera persica]WCJ59968.1 hybrid sensor histidine kinase/response regulator [Fontisphaera persica]
MHPSPSQPEFDYRRFAILYVDDEEASLRMFQAAFGQQFRILTAPNAAEGHRLLEAHHAELGVLMTDQRMPGEKGVQLLEKARRQYPRIVRILTTAYAELDAAIAAVNEGAIYKYITKPWDPVELEHVLRHALQFFIVQHERDQLLREKISTLHRLMLTDRLLSLGMFSAGLNHHLRNSLVAIRTFLELAPVKMAEEKISPNTLRDPEYWREFHAMAQGQIQRITEMLSSLGAAADRAEAGETALVDVAALLQEAIAVAQPELQRQQLRIQLQCDPQLPPLRGHPAKIRRLFDLLLRDEILTLPSGCTIKWQLQPGAGGQGVDILLEDNGRGLSADDLRFLFDPFYSRSPHPQELGINLMACFFLVYHEGGQIAVDNAPQGGTRFHIHLSGLPPEHDRLPQPDSKQWSLYEEIYEGLISGRAES